jgi:hypothetical protein
MITEYLNENENRSYPLAEDAPAVGANGTALPRDLIVDLGIVIPRGLAGTLYVSGVTVTPALLSVAIASTAGGAFTFTAARPVTLYRPYSLTSLISMASGYITFGRGAEYLQSGSFIFNSVVASGLDPRAVRLMDSQAVTSVGPYRGQDSIKFRNDISLVAGTNVTIRYADGKIKIGLAEAVRSQFVGPCDRQAIFNNCGAPPIRTINGVTPDANGIIAIEVQNG